MEHKVVSVLTLTYPFIPLLHDSSLAVLFRKNHLKTIKIKICTSCRFTVDLYQFTGDNNGRKSLRSTRKNHQTVYSKPSPPPPLPTSNKKFAAPCFFKHHNAVIYHRKYFKNHIKLAHLRCISAIIWMLNIRHFLELSYNKFCF